MSPTLLWAKTSGFSRASSTVGGSSGQPGVTAAYPASSKKVAQRSQLLVEQPQPVHEDHRLLARGVGTLDLPELGGGGGRDVGVAHVRSLGEDEWAVGGDRPAEREPSSPSSNARAA